MAEKPQVTSPVRALRERATKSQNELAAQVGISRSFLCEVEAGKYLPKPLLIRRLAAILDVPADVLHAEMRAHVNSRREPANQAA